MSIAFLDFFRLFVQVLHNTCHLGHHIAVHLAGVVSLAGMRGHLLRNGRYGLNALHDTRIGRLQICHRCPHGAGLLSNALRHLRDPFKALQHLFRGHGMGSVAVRHHVHSRGYLFQLCVDILDQFRNVPGLLPLPWPPQCWRLETTGWSDS